MIIIIKKRNSLFKLKEATLQSAFLARHPVLSLFGMLYLFSLVLVADVEEWV